MTKRKNDIQVSSPAPDPVRHTIFGQPIDTAGAQSKGQGVITTLGNSVFGFQMKPMLGGLAWNVEYFMLVSMSMGDMGSDKRFTGASWESVIEQAERYILRFCSSVRSVLDTVAPFVEQSVAAQPILASMQISMAPEVAPKPKQLAGKKREPRR